MISFHLRGPCVFECELILSLTDGQIKRQKSPDLEDLEKSHHLNLLNLRNIQETV